MPAVRDVRPNGPGDHSPGLRLKADALGQQAPQPGGLKGRESLRRELAGTAEETLATFQAAPIGHLSTQGIGLRPQPWAILSRPVGPVRRTGI